MGRPVLTFTANANGAISARLGSVDVGLIVAAYVRPGHNAAIMRYLPTNAARAWVGAVDVAAAKAELARIVSGWVEAAGWIAPGVGVEVSDDTVPPAPDDLNDAELRRGRVVRS